MGRAVALSTILGLANLLVLLGNNQLAVIIMGVAFLISSLGVPIYNINQVSLRQIITPNRLQGRMNATMRTIIWGTIPAGALLGGIFSTLVGIVPTLIAGSIIGGSSVLWIVLGPIFELKKQPDPVED